MPKMAMMSLMSAGVISLATASYVLGRYGWPRALRGRRSGKSAQDMTSLHHADERATQSWFRRASKTEKNDRPSSGNLAFDEYRVDTLKRLEEEQTEFSEFLAKLRRIKDDQDFEDFRSRQ